jgi:hypothetical protein
LHLPQLSSRKIITSSKICRRGEARRRIREKFYFTGRFNAMS